MGQGFGAAGHGPGSFGRGFGAAALAPIQHQQERQAFASQQAAQQAQTQMTQEQAAALPAQRAAQLAAMTAQPWFDPATRQYIGNMTDAQYQQYIRGQGAAQVTAQSRITTEQLKAGVSRGKSPKLTLCWNIPTSP